MKTSSHWIHMHNKEKQWIISLTYMWKQIYICGYMGARGGGGGWFNNQTGPILVHIYPLFNNNLHDKYRSNLIRTFWVTIKIWKFFKNKFNFFRGHVGPLHKIQGYQGHQHVSKRRPHQSGDICTTRGNNLKTSFSFMGQNVKKMYIFGGILGALRGSLMIRLDLSCFPAILSPIYMYIWNKEAIW